MTKSLLFVFLVILCVFFPVYKQETSLTNKNWKKTTKGEWIIKFYSDKCGACVQFQKEWLKFREKSEEMGFSVRFGEVNVDKEMELAIRFFVTSLPTLIWSDQGKFYVYTAGRSHNELLEFTELGVKGKATEIPWFRAPDSYGVRGLVSFLSVILKFQRLYQTFVEKNKYPGWLVIFIALLLSIAVATSFSLILAHLINFMFYSGRTPPPQAKPKITITKPESDDLDKAKHIKQA